MVPARARRSSRSSSTSSASTRVGSRVAQLDIEDHLGTPARYGVLSLPTVMIFAGGEVVETIDGAQPRRRYAEAVARVLGV